MVWKLFIYLTNGRCFGCLYKLFSVECCAKLLWRHIGDSWCVGNSLLLLTSVTPHEFLHLQYLILLILYRKKNILAIPLFVSVSILLLWPTHNFLWSIRHFTFLFNCADLNSSLIYIRILKHAVCFPFISNYSCSWKSTMIDNQKYWSYKMMML